MVRGLEPLPGLGARRSPRGPGQFLGFFSAKGLNRLLKLLGAISPWTNLLVPLAILRLDRGHPAGLAARRSAEAIRQLAETIHRLGQAVPRFAEAVRRSLEAFHQPTEAVHQSQEAVRR